MTIIPRLAVWAAVCTVTLVHGQPAPAPNPSTWTFVGPNSTDTPSQGVTSGKVSAIVVQPSGTTYIGAAGGGVWKRNGTVWTPLTDAQPSLQIGSLAIDPSNPSILYAGTGHMNSIPGYYGAGLLKSADAGATWTHIAGPFLGVLDNTSGVPGGSNSAGARIVALAVSPTSPNVVLAGVEFPISRLLDSGIYRSDDAGMTWAQVLRSGVPANALFFHPADGNIAYAAVSSTTGGFTAGIYRSNDGGRSWTRLVSGLPAAGRYGLTGLAIAPSDPQILYAGIADGISLGLSLIGVFKSTDGGNTWTQLPGAPAYCRPFCDQNNLIAVHPTDPGIVFFGGTLNPLHRTLDGGATFTDIGSHSVNGLPMHPDVAAFAFSPGGTTLYVATDGGLTSSTDFTSPTVTWTPQNGLGITQFYWGFDVDSNDANHVFAGTQDNGCQVFTGTLDWSAVAGWSDCANILYDSAADNPFLAEFSWTRLGGIPSNPYAAQVTTTGLDLTERRAPLGPPIAVDPRNSAVRYTGLERVYQTTDSQLTWTAISPRLPIGLGHHITSVAVAFHDLGIVCAGTSDGHVWCTANALHGSGATWHDLSAGLPARYVTRVSIDWQKNLIVVALGGFSGVGGDTGGHVYFTNSFAHPLQDISGNLPNTQVNDVMTDDFARGWLYAATDDGVFVTYDNGQTWARLARGLPRAIVTGLVMHRRTRTLYAGTFGRSMWRLIVPEAAPTLPAIAVDPWTIRFGWHPGTPPPPPFPVSIFNGGWPPTGPPPLHWSAAAQTSSGGNWLVATPSAGVDATQISVSVAPGGLKPGNYNGIVRIDDPASSNGPQDVTVLLSVTDAPPVAVAGTSFSTDATNPSGAMVPLDGRGSHDPDNDPLTFTWSGPFGTVTGPAPIVLLPIGMSTVRLTVADPAGLTSSASIQVTVRDAQTMASNLVVAVSNAGFTQGVPLVQTALDKIKEGNVPAACGKLSAFANQVNAQTGKQLTIAQAAQFITSESHIAGTLRCA